MSLLYGSLKRLNGKKDVTFFTAMAKHTSDRWTLQLSMLLTCIGKFSLDEFSLERIQIGKTMFRQIVHNTSI